MKKIALLTGWPGYERNIALKSVKLFEEHIGRPYETFFLPEQLDEFLSRRDEFEKVIPVFHWEYWEDGKLQALLELYNIPYVGSNYFTSALCMNKEKANKLAKVWWLLVPEEKMIKKWKQWDTADIHFPVIIKPKLWGSSYYTYKILSEEELKEKIDFIHTHIDDDILVQEYILWDEYSVSSVNGEILDAIMYVEKNNQEDFFDYESKYESETGMRETFPQIEEHLFQRLKSEAKKALDLFEVTWYARIDFIVQWEKIYFLEVNTIPGTASVSILPKAWKLSGRSFEEFVTYVLQ